MSVLLGVLGMGRSQAEARMTETAKVALEAPAVNASTLATTVTETVQIASVICRVKYPVLRVLDRESGTQLVAAQEVEVHFPSGTTPVPTDAIVTILTSTADAGLVAKRFRVRGSGQMGQTTALRVPVEEVS